MAQLFDDEDYRVPDEVLEAAYYDAYTTEAGKRILVVFNEKSLTALDAALTESGPPIDHAFDVVATRDELRR